MNRSAVVVLLAALSLLGLGLQREGARGTFDRLEHGWVSWLAANAGPRVDLPALTLVLFDDEASDVAGVGRIEMLDGALFARAAWRLGAVAAGVDGLSGEPRRMIEAAGGLPVFAGYVWTEPPAIGWSPWRGEPGDYWPEAPGLTGRPGRLARGFLEAPSGTSGAREILLAGQNGGRPVASFVVLAWAASQQWRWSEVAAEPRGFRGPEGRLIFNAAGRAKFFPEEPAVMTMGHLLMQAEQFEREGGEPPLRGRLLVLARTTSDVPRWADGHLAPMTAGERWATAWEAVRLNRLFLAPGWWYPPLVLAVAAGLIFGPARRSWRSTVLGGVFAIFLFALVGLAVFGTSRVLLPAAPTIILLLAALLLARVGYRAGWLGKPRS